MNKVSIFFSLRHTGSFTSCAFFSHLPKLKSVVNGRNPKQQRLHAPPSSFKGERNPPRFVCICIRIRLLQGRLVLPLHRPRPLNSSHADLTNPNFPLFFCDGNPHSLVLFLHPIGDRYRSGLRDSSPIGEFF
ncbi:hypothetical protein S245_046481 [Arachis hypogaea]